MKKEKKNNSISRLSLSQTITLVLISFAICLGIGVVFYENKTQNKVQAPVIVVTQEETVYDKSQDLIGDFILNHEYFAADEDIFFTEMNNEKEERSDITLDISNENNLGKDQDDNVDAKEKEPEYPLIAIVIDDMGINKKRTFDIISIKAPLTSSFLTYGSNLSSLVNQAKASGHEIMIHAPMEPKVAADLAPDTLKTNMTKKQIDELFIQMLQKFDNIEISGVNNHMGSKFTEDAEKLGYIMNILKQRDMFFLDSKTSSSSKGKDLATKNGIKFAERDVFLDNKNDYDYILNQLQKTEQIAQKKGFAIAICHPKSQTYLALKDWVESLKDKQFKLVHVSEIVQKNNKD